MVLDGRSIYRFVSESSSSVDTAFGAWTGLTEGDLGVVTLMSYRLLLLLLILSRLKAVSTAATLRALIVALG